MAKQKGLIKIEGTVGDLTFYNSGGEDLVRSKGGVSADRINSDPAFARTRENNTEFGNAGTAGKIFRNAFRTMIALISDSSLVSRLTQAFRSIVNFDTTSTRGQRTVANGIATVGGASFLSNFNINSLAGLGQVLFKAFTLNPTTKVLTIPQLLAVNDLVAPQGATHVTFRTATSMIDFASGNYSTTESNAVTRSLSAAASDVVLTPSSLPTGTGVLVTCLSISFTQEVNGVQYSLKNGAYNVLAVVNVD